MQEEDQTTRRLLREDAEIAAELDEAAELEQRTTYMSTKRMAIDWIELELAFEAKNSPVLE